MQTIAVVPRVEQAHAVAFDRCDIEFGNPTVILPLDTPSETTMTRTHARILPSAYAIGEEDAPDATVRMNLRAREKRQRSRCPFACSTLP